MGEREHDQELKVNAPLSDLRKTVSQRRLKSWHRETVLIDQPLFLCNVYDKLRL